MTLIDLFFNSVMIYALGSLLRVIPSHSEEYFRAALGFYLIKTVVWLGLRIPLMLPIDRWEKRGAPPEDNEPALIRAIYYFPFDFTLFYGAMLGAFYTAFMAWLIYGPGSIRLGHDLMFPGLMLAGSVCAGAIAVGVPVNLILTARLSRRLAERKASSFEDIPGKELSLGAKMATIALALGCAPSLLLFSVQTFVQDHGLYQEAERSAAAIMKGLAGEPPSSFHRWALSAGTHPFWVQDGRIGFAGPGEPPEQVAAVIITLLSASRDVSYVDRQYRFVIRMRPRKGGVHGVLVRVPDPQNHWLALSLVIMLASFWPLVTAMLLVRTIVGPISTIGSTFHRIIGRGRTEGSDRVPIFYKDEVGRLAFNANRTIDILTEARGQLEVTAANLAQKNQELEQAYRTKGEFLANMSHELRTPLNAIIGFSRLMKRKLGDTLPDRQAKNLEMIEQSGEQLLTLVNDLLDFEKIEAGKLDVRRQEVELGPLLEVLATTLGPLAAEKGLVLTVQAEGLPEVIESDRERLRQVLTNLVTNAVKYSDHGAVTLKAASEGDWAVFTVTDQGIGMTPEQMEKIFDPFHQVDASQTRERGGVGLGLAIVARLVRLLRGRISVTSQVGVGSTFTVRFPLGDGTSHLVPTGSGAEIMVVDDNMDYLESIYGELSAAGFRVVSASSGQQALDLLRDLRPAAILLDIVMPEMDGWEVLRRLRAQPELGKIPVVITSVVNDRPVGLDVDFAGWLSKPFEFEELKRFLIADKMAGGREGLVIVEDDPQTAQLLEQVFEDSGITPAIFAREGEAREHLSRSLPAVLILDLNLEEGSGWSVLTYLRSLPDSERTRVFIYTASDLTAEEKARLNESFVTVVNKHGRDSLSQLVSTIVGEKPA
jgi:signal transduction histidine kinase/DNA-binding response OmpR family regulator